MDVCVTVVVVLVGVYAVVGVVVGVVVVGCGYVYDNGVVDDIRVKCGNVDVCVGVGIVDIWCFYY